MVICSLIIGIFGAKFFNWLKERKIKKDAIKVIKGEKENKCEIDGKIVEAKKFKVRDESDKEICVNFGVIIEKEEKENKTHKIKTK